MSQTNEPPLALESWKIVAKLNDGTDIILEPDDLRKSLRYEIEEAISECVEFRVDHLKSKYAGETDDSSEN